MVRKKKKTGMIVLAATILFTAIAIMVAFYAFLSDGNDFEKAAYPMKYQDEIEAAAWEYGVDQALIYAVIRTESGFDPDAGSSAGALGLMQIIPETFEWLQTYYNGEVTMETEMLYDPQVNIEYGTMFLKFLLERYEPEETAVAAYNAGFGAVDQWLSDNAYSDDGKSLTYIPYPETAEYVVKVENAKEKYKQLYRL